MQVTDATLCREFNKQCGLSCKKLLLYLKVRYAAGLIRNSTLLLKQISDETGFKHPERFAEAFLKITGMSPSGYRKKMYQISPEDFWREKWQNIKKA